MQSSRSQLNARGEISKRQRPYVTVNSSVCPCPVIVLTNVSSNVTVMGWDIISVTVAVGATVLKTVVKPDDMSIEVGSGGTPPDGSTTIVPGRSVRGIVISPSPAVTVITCPPVGLRVAVAVPVLVAVPEETAEPLEGTRPGIRSTGGGLEGWGCAWRTLRAEVQALSPSPSSLLCTSTGRGMIAK